jgi:hypothetical protein
LTIMTDYWRHVRQRKVVGEEEGQGQTRRAFSLPSFAVQFADAFLDICAYSPAPPYIPTPLPACTRWRMQGDSAHRRRLGPRLAEHAHERAVQLRASAYLAPRSALTCGVNGPGIHLTRGCRVNLYSANGTGARECSSPRTYVSVPMGKQSMALGWRSSAKAFGPGRAQVGIAWFCGPLTRVSAAAQAWT